MEGRTRHSNPVSKAIYAKYDNLQDFIQAFEEPNERLYYQTVYAWVRRGRLSPEYAKRFAKHFKNVKLEDII